MVVNGASSLEPVAPKFGVVMSAGIEASLSTKSISFSGTWVCARSGACDAPRLLHVI